MAVLLSDLRTRVNNKMHNYTFWVTYRSKGDGVNRDFHLPIGDLATLTAVTVSTKSVAYPTVITTSADHGLATGQSVVIAGGTGGTSINGTYTVTVLASNQFSIQVNVSSGTITIAPTVTPVPIAMSLALSGTTVSTKSVASPTLITTAGPHGLSSGDVVVIAGGTGGTDINGTWTVTVASTTTFTIPVNVTVATITIAPTVNRQPQVSALDLGAPTFTSPTAPADQVAVTIRYQCQLWSTADVDAALNEAIRYFGPRFPVDGYDASLAASTELEYTIPATVGYIFRVEVWNAAGTDYEKIKGWITYLNGSGDRKILFPLVPTSGTIRLYHKKNPTSLVNASDGLLAVAFIDEKSQDALVYFAVGTLLNDNVAQRVRQNAFTNVDAANAPKFWDVKNASDDFLGKAEKRAEAARATPKVDRY